MPKWLFSSKRAKNGDSPVAFLDPSSDDSFFGQREFVRQEVEEKGEVDFNVLSPTGKQAAYSLSQERIVEIVERGGRPMVVGRKKRGWVEFLTIGLAS